MKKTQGKFCYATLTRHPLNPIKVLGEFKNEEILPWFKTEEQVITVSECLPLMVTYNNELRRNAFHVLIANMTEIKKEYEVAFLPTQSYSLWNLNDNSHHEVLTLTLH